MNILINYADRMYYSSRKKNSESGLRNGFDAIKEWCKEDLGLIVEMNKGIFNEVKGAGYWLWKPWIIYKTLLEMSSDDVLFYCDSGSEFIAPVNEIMDICREDSNGLILFEGAHMNKKYTKRDCFILMGCDSLEYTDIKQLTASFQVCRKTDFSLQFYEEHINAAQNANILTDIPNITKENYPEFIDHRHDQSILTNLTVKHNVTLLQDPSQWGNDVGGAGIINHHRNKA